MEFCTVCDNLLYLRTDEDNKLIRYCKNCNFEKQEAQHGLRISKTQYSEDEMLYKYHQNPYLRYDPTLPRVNNIVCPNPSCQKSQVLYIKYHPEKMLYLYCCDFCGHFWKADDKKN